MKCPNQTSLSRRYALVMLAGLLAAHCSPAATDTWTGGGASDGNWQTANNWGGTAPVAGDFLFFDTGTQLLTTNNFSSGTIFGGIVFNSGAGSFALSGNSIVLPGPSQDTSGNIRGGSITNFSANAQTIGLPLTLTDGLHYIVNGGAGQLNLSGTVTRNADATAALNTNSGPINTTGSGLANDSSANSGVLGGWAVIGTANNLGNWATLGGSGNVSSYTGYTSFNGGTSFGGTQTGKNVKIQTRSSTASSLNGATAGTCDMNTLLWNTGNANPAGSQTLNISSGQILRLGTNGGIMNVHGGRAFIIGNGVNGVLTAGGPNNNTAGELTLVQLSANGGQLQINTTLADNGSGPVTVNQVGSVNYNFANTYSGGTHIHFGEAFLSGGARIGSGPIYVYPGGRADFGSQNGATITNNFFIAGQGFVQAAQPGTVKGLFNGIFTGTFTLMGSASIDPNAGASPNTCTFTGPFTGTGSLSIGGSVSAAGYVEGTATLGGNCNFTGDAIIDATPNNNGGAGIKIFTGTNNIMNNGGNLNLIGGSTGVASFDLNGTTQTINGLTNTSGNAANATVKSSAGGGVLVVGNNNVSSTFGGVIQNGSGTVALTKTGTGTLTLSGANTYTGTTTISNGVLALSGSIANTAQILISSGATFDVSPLGTFTLGSGQTLGGNGGVTGIVTTASGSTISPGFGAGTLMFSNDLTLNSGNTCLFELSSTTNGANDQIIVAGNLNLAGATIQISAAMLQLGRYKLIAYGLAESGTAAANLVLSYVPSGVTVALDDSIPGEIDLLVTPGAPETLTWKGDGAANVWDVSSTANWTTNGAGSFVFTNGSLVIFNDSGSKSPAMNLAATVQPVSLLVSNNTGTYTFSGGGNISGGTALVKKGSGTLALTESGVDNFSGGILVGGGSLILSNTSMNISGGIKVANGALTDADNGTISGDLTVSNGTALLDGSGTISGNTVIGSTSTLQLGNNDANGTLPSGTVNNNGTLIFNHTDDITVANAISGSGSLIKTNTDIVTLTGTSSIGGNVAISSGILKSPNASGLGSFGSGTISIASGATLDKGTDKVKPIVVSGAGAGGNGAIVNTSGNPVLDGGSGGLTPSLTLLGDTTLGGNTRLDLGGTAGSILNTGGSNYNITIQTSSYMEWQRVVIDTNFGNIDIVTGTFGIKGMGTTGLGNPTNTITVESGSELQFWDDSLGNSGYAKNIHVLTGGTVSFRPGNPNIFYNTPLLLADGATWNMFNGSGNGTVLLQPIQLNGLVHLQVGDSTCTVSNVISGPGGFYWDNFNNTLVFTATNTYSGVTDIRSARTLSLTGNGSISSSTNILLEVAGAILNATGRGDSTLTLASGQTLGGIGTLRGNLIVGSGATVLPGVNGSLGVFTVTNGNVTLSGTTAMKLNESSATNDVLRATTAAASITYGGTLTATNLAGMLALGNSFPLFSAASYAGTFAATNLPALDTGLVWSWNPANGTLSVVPSVNPNPTNITAVVSGNQLTLSWPADHTGWRLQVQTNSLATGIGTNWSDVAGSTSVNSLNVTLDPANGPVFYRMVYP